MSKRACDGNGQGTGAHPSATRVGGVEKTGATVGPVRPHVRHGSMRCCGAFSADAGCDCLGAP